MAVFATSAGVALQRQATTDSLDETYIQAAIEATRADIVAVPGSGSVNCVFVLNGDVYAIRDNAGGTAGVLHKATTAGWEEQDLGEVIDFTAGTAAFAEGETLTGGTSGATGTIRQITVTSGDWTTNDAAGYMTLYDVTGTFTAAETGTSASGSATLTADSTAQTLSPGGVYSHTTHNFFGGLTTRAAYGCNGLDYGWEWDGSYFSFIRTGTTPDTPTNVIVHKEHLFFTINSSLIFSAPGDPFDFTAATAGEIATGAEIKGLIPCPGGILNAFGRDRDGYLFGNDTSDFQFKQQSNTQGGIAQTGQLLGSLPICVDEMGILVKNVTDQFGDFKTMVMSDKVKQLLTGRYDNISCTGINTGKGLYRVWFDDKSGITMGINEQGLTGFYVLSYLDQPTCFGRGENATGDEVGYFGCDDGFVYQLDKGTSFDGGSITATLRFAFNHVGTPQNKKRFFIVFLELTAPNDLSLNVTPDFSYADPDNVSASTETFSVSSGGGFWDFATWNQFNWSEAVVATGKVHVDGSGTNISLLIYSDDTYVAPHTIEGYTLHYSVRGMTR